MFYEDHIIEAMASGGVLIDFIKELDPNGALFFGTDVYIKKSVVEEITGIKWKKLPRGSYAAILKSRKVLSFEEKSGMLVINFDKPVSEDMVSMNVDDDTLKVLIEPVESGIEPPQGIFGIYSGNSLYLKLKTPEGFSPRLRVEKNKIIIINDIMEKDFFGEYKVYEGIVWKRVKETFNNKEYIIDYLDIDLNKIRLVPEIAENGIGSLENVDSMVKRTGSLAGVNASYFDPKSGMIIGLLIRNGVPLSAPYGGRPIFFITDEGEAYIERMNVEVDVQLGDTLLYIKGINTIAKGEVLMYTKDFGKKIPEEKDKIYILIKNGFVEKFGYKYPLDNGEYLLSIASKFKDFLYDVKENTPARILIQTSFDLNIMQAIEGGPFLISGGKPLPDSVSEKLRYSGGIPFARAPRTIVALKSRKRLSFIVIEQDSSHPGMNYDEMVEFLLQKGYVSAMCFDGGSSTSLVIHGEIVNFTKYGKTPYVAVGLLAFPIK
ncbi:MAG: phosphodiester glycosidase family protein [Thermotogaceae bacterium]|nr:phosphodiester glycosidase family protein [Thermotogaceae bacterium]